MNWDTTRGSGIDSYMGANRSPVLVQDILLLHGVWMQGIY